MSINTPLQYFSFSFSDTRIVLQRGEGLSDEDQNSLYNIIVLEEAGLAYLTTSRYGTVFTQFLKIASGILALSTPH